MRKHLYQVLFIVEDKIDQTVFTRMVARENLQYDFQIVNSIKKAIKILSEKDFDIIITDYNLGDGTAMDVLESKPDCPVVIATSDGNEEIAVKAMKAGAYNYLVKRNGWNYLKTLPMVVEKAVNHKRAIAALKKTEAEKEQLIQELKKALANIKTLTGLIPICAWCKKVRNDQGYWEKVESYISRYSQAEFTHAVCPECSEKVKESLREKNPISSKNFPNIEI